MESKREYGLENKCVFEVEELSQIIVNYVKGANNYNIDCIIQLESLTFVSLVVELESKLGIEFEFEYLDHRRFNTVKSICNYVQERLDRMVNSETNIPKAS